MSAPSTGTIADARPHSAWVLVTVASAVLWITGQLAPWIPPVQIAVLGLTWWRRLDPLPIQRSDLALNVGMMCITATTISVALEGNPSTVSLAHFCALTQVLQLLDVRPRKSEFLLVTLALFQVILAANLTDSVFFPPLLAVFVGAATWTLVIHTLRVEALQAETPVRGDAALTPSLARLTLLASVASLTLAVVFFVAMPRFKTSMLRGGMGGSRAVAGFNDQVELGTLGQIRQDRTVVLRVETLSGEAPGAVDAYWRGLSFDAFDGRRWRVSTPPGVAVRTRLEGSSRFGKHIVPTPPPRVAARRARARGVEPGAAPERLVQRITREPVSSGVLFAAGVVRGLDGPKTRVEGDPNGGLYAPLAVEERIRYVVTSEAAPPDPASLSKLSALPPLLVGGSGARDDRFLALPELRPEVEALARRITATAGSDYGRASAIESHLRRVGRYSDVPPRIDDTRSETPVEQFLLGELQGHCEYFASGMVVLARSVGLPARLVNGFAGGQPNRLGGFTELTRSDAHAWVEIHFDEAGWVRFDPTPPDLRMRAAEAGLWAELGAIGSALELWWFQRVVEFDSSDQVAALRSAFQTWRDLRGDSEGSGRPRRRDLRSLRDWLPSEGSGWAIAVIGAASLLFVAWRLSPKPPGHLPPAYARALVRLELVGVVRSPAMPARELAARVREQCPAGVGEAFEALTEAYLAERFGGRPSTEDQWQALAQAFEFQVKQFRKAPARLQETDRAA